MQGSNFWHISESYNVHVVPLNVPSAISEQAKSLILESLAITEVLYANEKFRHQWKEQISSIVLQRMKTIFLSLSTTLSDEDSKKSLEMRARMLKAE